MNFENAKSIFKYFFQKFNLYSEKYFLKHKLNIRKTFFVFKLNFEEN